MKSVLSVISLFLLINCNREDKPPVNTQPYPSLEEQRQSLSAKPFAIPVRLLDSTQVVTDLQYLSSDICEGRKPGSPGHRKAMERVLERMREAQLDSFGNSLLQSFTGVNIAGTTAGNNIVGWVQGSAEPDKYIVITAHYDHLGKTAAGTYYGADDNASGAACLLAMAGYFKQNPHRYSLIFAVLDREETGLEGAYALVNKLGTEPGLTSIKFNLNMDMIARSDNNEIFACGIAHYPSFAYAINDIQNKTNVKLLMGHDGGSPGDDWTKLSDQGAFHEQHIPFIYIGVEDHPDYHKVTDTYDKVNYSSYIENCNMVVLMAKALKP